MTCLTQKKHLVERFPYLIPLYDLHCFVLENPASRDLYPPKVTLFDKEVVKAAYIAQLS